MARSAHSYRSARRNKMRELKMTWHDFCRAFPVLRKTRPRPKKRAS
jgi:hypothetical protein